MFLSLLLTATLHFAVLSDPHVLAPSLVDPSATYTEARLVEHSAELLDSALVRIQAAAPDVLLIPGDLTNNSELASHMYVHTKLAALVQSGMQVYVVPGNHDINAPSSVTTLTTKAQFASLYADCGYNQAVMRQSGDLGYMVYPNSQWALICLNSTQENGSTRLSAGGLTEATLQWAESAAATAQASGRQVMVMMHHPVVEHFDAHARFASNYIANQLEQYPSLESLQARFTAAGIHVVFTGHYHLNSIQEASTASGSLHDIMTGCLSSFRCPLRQGQLNSDGSVQVSTEHILRYDSLARQRNEATAIGAMQILSSQFYSKLQAVPATMRMFLNMPASAAQMNADMSSYMLPSFTAILNELSEGDEETRMPDTLYQAGCQAYHDYLLYLCKNSTLVESQLENLIKTSGYDLEGVYASMLYNYVGESSHVVPDGSISIAGSGVQTSREEIKSPQEIKYELKEGHLEIKSPQGIYAPNGALLKKK